MLDFQAGDGSERHPTGVFMTTEVSAIFRAVAVQPAASHYEGQVVPVQVLGHVARHEDTEAVGQRRITVAGRRGADADAATSNAPCTAQRRRGSAKCSWRGRRLRITITAFETTLFRECGKTGVKERFLKRAQPLAEFRVLWLYRRMNAVEFWPGQAAAIKHVYYYNVNTSSGHPRSTLDRTFCTSVLVFTFTVQCWFLHRSALCSAAPNVITLNCYFPNWLCILSPSNHVT